MAQATIPAPKRDFHLPTAFTPPPGACDTHCHVFGPAHRFPFAEDRRYTPPDSGYEDLVDLHDRLGLDRGVIVQASCHGTDNSALLDALQRGEGRFAGVAMIDETHTKEQLAEMDRVGVRGIRFNFVRHLGAAPDWRRFWSQVERVEPLGWHVDLHVDPTELSSHASLWADLPTRFVIDHMARVDAAAGMGQKPFQLLLELLGTNDRAWVKISGAERITADGQRPYDDVVPFAHALIRTAPKRVLWGTDWPHPNVAHMPDDGDLADLLALFAPDETVRDRILVGNPAALYGF